MRALYDRICLDEKSMEDLIFQSNEVFYYIVNYS